MDFKTVQPHWNFTTLIKTMPEIWTCERDTHIWETRYDKFCWWITQQKTPKNIFFFITGCSHHKPPKSISKYTPFSPVCFLSRHDSHQLSFCIL